MRLVLLALLFGAAVFAQSPPAAPEAPATPPAQPAAPPPTLNLKGRDLFGLLGKATAQKQMSPEESARVTEMLGNTLMSAAKTCSIPLLNAMPPNAPPIDKGMILPAPKNTGRFAILQVSPPAPPCAAPEAKK